MVLYLTELCYREGGERRGEEGKRLRGHDLTLALHGQFFGGILFWA
jgi:hypothetical protein